MTKSNGQVTPEIKHSRGTKPRRRPSGVYLPKARSRITNGKFLLPDVDNRSLWVRRFRDVRALHLQDLGGEENCSVAEQSIIRRAALLTVELERLEMIFAQDGGASDFKIEQYQRLANSLRRLLEAVGLQRRARNVTPTVAEYVRQLNEAAE